MFFEVPRSAFVLTVTMVIGTLVNSCFPSIFCYISGNVCFAMGIKVTVELFTLFSVSIATASATMPLADKCFPPFIVRLFFLGGGGGGVWQQQVVNTVSSTL